ncbi:MAG: energy-coupling factor transporter transmembrane component T family protein [Acutalibacteraceae bacterium]
MISDITIGQFMPGKSYIHKMDPRMKIITMVALIVSVFLAKNLMSMGLMLGFVLLMMLLSRVPMKMYFKGLKAIWFLVLFTAALNMLYIRGDAGQVLWFQWIDGALNMLYVRGDTELLKFWIFTVTVGGLWQSLFIAMRLVLIIVISSMLTYTTSPTDLTAAIERLLGPLKLIRVPVHELAMMMTIALRFIPTLLEETEKIMNAQKARGADMESGGVIQRAKALIPILIPLFISSFRRAFDLATAMDCRCYSGGSGRTRMNVLKYKFRDIFAFNITAAICTAIIYLNTLAPSLVQ